MALVQIADVINHKDFTRHALLESLRKSALFDSGVVMTDAELSRLCAANIGNVFEFGAFNDLADDATNVSSDDPATLAVPKKITTQNELAVKLMRNQAWSSADLARAVSATGDPMQAIASRVGAYWSRAWDLSTIRTANGVIANNIANNGSDMINVIGSAAATTPTAAQLVSIGAVIDAKATAGDRGEEFTAMVMHSKVFYDLEKAGYVDKIYNDQGVLLYRSAFGMRIMVSDSVNTDTAGASALYDTYLFKGGVFSFGLGSPNMSEEIEREGLQGNGEGVESLISRRHFSIHPNGHSYVGATVANANPTDANLIDAASWSRVQDRKRVGFAVLRSN